METDEDQELRAYVLGLVHALFSDDALAGVADRLPDPPAAVSGVVPFPHPQDAERVLGFDLAGTFSVSKVMKLALNGGVFHDRYDEVEAYVTPWDRPEHLGARLTMQGQPGATVSKLAVRAETLRNPPTPPMSEPANTPAPPTAVPSPAVPPAAAAPPQADELVPLIGGIEPVPAFDLGSLLTEREHHQIETMRSFEAFPQISCYMAADPGMIRYGLPPSFAPVIRLGTDGMVIGIMVDAPELGFASELGCLYEISSEGLTLADARVNVLGVIYRSLRERQQWLEEDGDQTKLTAWEQSAHEFANLMGYRELSKFGLLDFAWRDKRRKPPRSPKGTKWRTDAGGNGVLALLEAWGDDPVRKPKSIEAALATAPDRAPALALHLLREALVLANRANDAASCPAIYQAMVDPLERLGRTQAAARSQALADF